MQIDDLTYVENFSIPTGPFPPAAAPRNLGRVAGLRGDSVDPERAAAVERRRSRQYNVAQIFAWRASKFGRPLMRIPSTEENLVGFAVIRYAANASQVDLMLKANRRLFEEVRALGGTLYPFSAVNLSRAEWRKHYGQDFDQLACAKRRYDSKNVLASGPDIF